MIRELQDFGCRVDIHDPWADPQEVRMEYDVTLLPPSDTPDFTTYQAVVLAVAHLQFLQLALKIGGEQVIYDIKSVLGESGGSL